MSRFRLTPAARQRLKIIGRDTQKVWGLAQRNKYLAELDKGFHDLAIRPDKGRARFEVSADLFSFHLNSHVIFYYIRPAHIEIVDILHERMEPLLHL
jgi:toxin ParE1/3/4